MFQEAPKEISVRDVVGVSTRIEASMSRIVTGITDGHIAVAGIIVMQILGSADGEDRHQGGPFFLRY